MELTHESNGGGHRGQLDKEEAGHLDGKDHVLKVRFGGNVILRKGGVKGDPSLQLVVDLLHFLPLGRIGVPAEGLDFRVPCPPPVQHANHEGGLDNHEEGLDDHVDEQGLGFLKGFVRVGGGTKGDDPRPELRRRKGGVKDHHGTGDEEEAGRELGVDEEGSREDPLEEGDPEEVPEGGHGSHGRKEDGESFRAGGKIEPGHARRLERDGDCGHREEVEEGGEPGGELEAQVRDDLHDLKEGGDLLEADLVAEVQLDPCQTGFKRRDPDRGQVEEGSQGDHSQEYEDGMEEGGPASREALGALLSHLVGAGRTLVAEVAGLVPSMKAPSLRGIGFTGFAGKSHDPFHCSAHFGRRREDAGHFGRLAPGEEGVRGSSFHLGSPQIEDSQLDQVGEGG